MIVLDKGMIAEFDSPAALLDDKNSIFYGMAKNAGLVNNNSNNNATAYELDSNDTKL